VRPCDFSFSVGCTDASDTAPVIVTPTGGVAPYTLMVDEQDYQPLPEILILNSGEHTLTLRDSEGRQSPVRNVYVAPQLLFGEPSFDCGEDYSSYRASLTISGGIPPYRVNGQAIDGDGYTSEWIDSGTAVDLEVLDSRDCAAAITFTHTCVQPCDFSFSVGCTDAEGHGAGDRDADRRRCALHAHDRRAGLPATAGNTHSEQRRAYADAAGQSKARIAHADRRALRSNCSR
jgi:hypothetical protein